MATHPDIDMACRRFCQTHLKVINITMYLITERGVINFKFRTQQI